MKGNKYIIPFLLEDNRLLIALTHDGAGHIRKMQDNPQHDEFSMWIDLVHGSDLDMVMSEHIDFGFPVFPILSYKAEWSDKGMRITPDTRVWFWNMPQMPITHLLRHWSIILASYTSEAEIEAGRVARMIPHAIQLLTDTLPALGKAHFITTFDVQQGADIWYHYAKHGLASTWKVLTEHNRNLFCNLLLNTSKTLSNEVSK